MKSCQIGAVIFKGGSRQYHTFNYQKILSKLKIFLKVFSAN